MLSDDKLQTTADRSPRRVRSEEGIFTAFIHGEGVPPMQTTRAYHYTFDGPSSSNVRFWNPGGEDHLLFFYRLDLKAAEDRRPGVQVATAEHLCVNDLYSIHMTLDVVQSAWRTAWTVVGPAKDFTIHTEYAAPAGSKI